MVANWLQKTTCATRRMRNAKRQSQKSAVPSTGTWTSTVTSTADSWVDC